MYIVASNDGPWDYSTAGAVGIVKDSIALQQFIEDRNGSQERYNSCSGDEKCQEKMAELELDCIVDGTIITMYYQQDGKVYIMVDVDRIRREDHSSY